MNPYIILPGDGAGTVEGTASGFRLRGGPYYDFASGVRLFSTFSLPASGAVYYRLTREVVPPVVTSEGAWLNVGIVWGPDPATLPADTPTDDIATATMWVGWRVTHANKNPVAAGSNRIKIRNYPDRAAIPPRETRALANFKPGVPSGVVLTWGGDAVSLAVPGMGAGARQSWADTTLRVPAGVGPRLMFYGSFGGCWLVEDVRLPA